MPWAFVLFRILSILIRLKLDQRPTKFNCLEFSLLKIQNFLFSVLNSTKAIALTSMEHAGQESALAPGLRYCGRLWPPKLPGLLFPDICYFKLQHIKIQFLDHSYLILFLLLPRLSSPFF